MLFPEVLPLELTTGGNLVSCCKRGAGVSVLGRPKRIPGLVTAAIVDLLAFLTTAAFLASIAAILAEISGEIPEAL